MFNNRIKMHLSSDFFCQDSFLLFNKTRTWIEALRHCDSLNLSLVQITNQTVQNAVTSLVQNKSGLDRVWVGLERSIFGTDPDWMWISDSKAENLKWNSSFPVDRFNNHCGKIILDEESGEIQFLDASCHDELPYICQGELSLCFCLIWL